jgi:hypothetical protein
MTLAFANPRTVLGTSRGDAWAKTPELWARNITAEDSFPNGAVGNDGRYNYSPSVIETANTREFWWRGPASN